MSNLKKTFKDSLSCIFLSSELETINNSLDLALNLLNSSNYSTKKSRLRGHILMAKVLIERNHQNTIF